MIEDREQVQLISANLEVLCDTLVHDDDFQICIHTQGTTPVQWESKVDIDTAKGVVVFTHGGNAGKCDKLLRKHSSLFCESSV